MQVLPDQIRLLLIILSVTLLSGIGDAQGFIHAAKIWHEGKLVWGELVKSALGFIIGISLYWIAVRFLHQLGILSAEAQTLLWFSITLIGVAFFSGKFFEWAFTDQVVAMMVFAGIGWLLWRTGG